MHSLILLTNHQEEMQLNRPTTWHETSKYTDAYLNPNKLLNYLSLKATT